MDKAPIYSSYRPHNPGHNYYGSGIYLITLVVRGRDAIMGMLKNDGGQPTVSLSPLGQIVQEEWEHTIHIQQKHGRQLRLLAQCVMPDHWHGVIEVEQDIDKSIGAIIQATKSACTSRWWQISGMLSSPSSAESIRHMHVVVREQYYAEHDGPKPLFDANYDDTICIDDRHRQAMINYVNDNPRRAWLRRQHPDLFKLRREIHRNCDGINLTFSAMGNIFLLDYPYRQMIQCSRTMRTEDFEAQKRTAIQNAEKGAVTYTAAVSEGERIIARTIREAGYPVVILLKDGFPQAGSEHERYFKPNGVYFETCATGRLLLLEPIESTYLDTKIEQLTQNTLRQKAEIKHQYYTPLPTNSQRYRYIALNTIGSLLTAENEFCEKITK